MTEEVTSTMGTKGTISSFIDSLILSIFPQLSTHLKHSTVDHQSLSTQLFPHDTLIAALAISFNRYTVKYPNESKISRIFWSALLGYLAYSDYDYWILISIHFLSFGHYLFRWLEAKISSKGKVS